MDAKAWYVLAFILAVLAAVFGALSHKHVYLQSTYRALLAAAIAVALIPRAFNVH